MKKEFKYYIYNPSGNITALVEGNNIDEKTMKIINDEIMKNNKSIEQVGFINNKKYELKMAGGEFCCNATRCAAYHYLNGKSKEIEIFVTNIVKAGVNDNGVAYCEIPLLKETSKLIKLDRGIYYIKMDGISHIVLDKKTSKKYINNIRNIKTTAMTLIEKYDIKDNEAIGVIFTEEVNSRLKIHPVVWVQKIDTLFYENACGSGTTACAIIESILGNKSICIDIMQPSNDVLTVKTEYINSEIKKVILFGRIKADEKVYSITIDI